MRDEGRYGGGGESHLLTYTKLGPLIFNYSYKPIILLSLLLYTRLIAVFSSCENVAIDRNTRDHLASWTAGNWDPMHKVCVSHTGYLAHGNSKGETRGRSRNKNNSKRGV